MPYSLLVLVLLLPSTTLAQQLQEDKELAKLDSVVKSTVLAERQSISSASLIYRDGYVIAHPTFLYRTLQAAHRGRYTHRLRVGDEVFLARYSPNPHWLRVARCTYLRETVPQGDTTIYYMPQSAVRSKTGLVKTFSLH
jgi:hypothetical protein